MIIKIPKNNIPERTYIIDILIGEYLGLSYSIEVSDITNYHLLFEGKEIVIEDHFFKHYLEDLSYLKVDAIPKVVIFTENQFISEQDVPVLFGNDSLVMESKRIMYGNDFFAASFFMLTRWEEYVNPERDLHNRFSARDSLAHKFDFLDRPIVNEYVEMLWGMFTYLGYTEDRKKREYEFVLTHDVDILRLYRGRKQLIRKMGAEVIRRKSPLSAIRTLIEYVQVRLNKVLDPFDTFSWIMDLSESVNVKSRFYFMSGGVTSFDNHYNIEEPKALKVIEEVKRRGHIIGFHPSFNAYNDSAQWKKEKDLLEKVVGHEVKEGRQHYLRFEVQKTWNICEENDMERDLTLSYADKEGFRCGVCYEYSIFDFLNRKKLRLKEMPLIVMEGSFVTYQNVTSEEMYRKTSSLRDTVKKYNGSFVYLWHNSSFNVPYWSPYQKVYEKIVKENE
ncbi:polysaccharide deacetylase family protein [Sporosarcina sp. E16_3]|uniref:polysaccharide deacetylase family protein n=1 Tax=Sporosarcina sp. E16_3 TaxID=2789293 RepID=UPI001A91CFF7|nr:polysaccharide deacetylase family protein [Sporosarcina sp. E16_3]